MEFELEKRKKVIPVIRVVSSNMDISMELNDEDDFKILDLIVNRVKSDAPQH